MTSARGAYCAVYGCRNHKGKKALSFFKLPKHEERRREWCELIGRPELAAPDVKHDSHMICSEHFDKSDIVDNPRLKPDAVPSQHIPNHHDIPEESTETSTPKQKEAATQTLDTNVSMSIVKKADTTSQSVQTPTSDTHQATQTIVRHPANSPRKRKLCNEMRNLKNVYKKLKLELEKIKNELQSKEYELLVFKQKL